MKNIAKVCYFFSVCFFCVLMVWTATSFFQVTEINAGVVTLPIFSFWEFLSMARSGIPFTLYLSVLLGLSYTARQEIRVIPSIIAIFLLAVGLTILSIWTISQVPSFLPVSGKPVSLARDGLIMTTSGREKSVFFSATLQSDSDDEMSVLGEIQQDLDSAKPLSFKFDRILFAQDIEEDFLRLAGNLERLMEIGFANAVIYIAGLTVLLISMRFIMDLSYWALANLFLGFVAFGGILAFELFMNSSRVQAVLLSFRVDGISTSFINPLIYCVTGLLVMGTSGVFYLAKKGKKKRNNA